MYKAISSHSLRVSFLVLLRNSPIDETILKLPLLWSVRDHFEALCVRGLVEVKEQGQI